MQFRDLLQFTQRTLLASYGCIVIAGIVAVVIRDPVVATPRSPDAEKAFREANADETDFARWERGAVVRASGYATQADHHPLYLIDGLAEDARNVQKWVSHPEDRSPWFEVELAGPIDVSRVRVAHAGVSESPKLSIHRYEIICLRSDEEVARHDVSVDLATWKEHEPKCSNTDTIRFEFEVGPIERLDGVVRIYEVEVYGEQLDG